MVNLKSLRISDEQAIQEIMAAMMPPAQPGGARPKVLPQAFESLLQRAQQRRGAAKPGIKMSPEQRADLKAKALPTKREEMS